MHARREDLFTPAWSGDRLDAECPPEIEAPYFDTALEAWVLSRHADVLAALRAPGLSPCGPRRKSRADAPDDCARLKMRQQTLEALSPFQLQVWHDRLIPHINALPDHLPEDRPVDIIGEYARPLCLHLAAMVTGIDGDTAKCMEEKARHVSAAAAEPYDRALRLCADKANEDLRACFHTGPESLRDSGFVALSQTTACVLGNMWFALVQHPQAWRQLHQRPELTEQALEELLRYACLVRVLFRLATGEVNLNGIVIRKRERVILRIFAANRDSERFPCADQLDIIRRDAGHLAFGSGAHSCAGAGLIRMAIVAVTLPLVTRFSEASLAMPVEWKGGSGFRFPSSLWVRLRERQD